MFGNEDEPLHPAGLGGGGDLVRVKRGGVEQRRLFIAEAPLLVGEGVHAEMDKCI